MENEPRHAGLRLAVAPITHVEVRDATGTGDGSWTMGGYAAVYGQETTLWEIPGFIRVREEIAPGAFRNVLDRVARGEELVHFNHGHDMKTAVATSDVRRSGDYLPIGGLELTDDAHGVRFFARVDQEDPDARALAVKMRNKVVRQSSFAFTIADEERTAVETDDFYDVKYTINEIGHLYDVCACAQGAYSQTESGLRSLAAASMRVPVLGMLGRDGEDPSGHGRRFETEIAGKLDELRDLFEKGGSSIAPTPAGEGESKRAWELTQLRAYARHSLIERKAA